MSEQDILNYNRIAKTISYIMENYRNQPSLDELAEHVHLSPSHFQQLFTDWAGTDPNNFLQYISIGHAKRLLKEQRATLFDAAFDISLHGTSRLHDLFVNIEGMTPAEYKNGGRNLEVCYSFGCTAFGSVLVASTSKGICHVGFINSEEDGVMELKRLFPQAAFSQSSDSVQEHVLRIFAGNGSDAPLPLHVKGTDFQLKVWSALLKIPLGSLASYGSIASQLAMPHASRAVGTAIGANPVAYLIPCHRVIQASGQFGEYRWGSTRKTALIGWEACQTELVLRQFSV